MTSWTHTAQTRQRSERPTRIAGARARVWPLMLAGLVGVSTLFGGCGKGVTDSTIAFVGIDEVRELQIEDESEPRTLLLIDPRPLRRYAEAHIPGAMTLQLPEVPTYGGRDARLQGHAHLIVYGENPASPTARAMTKRLLAIGYTGVRMFAGGLEAWQQADLPIETSPMPESED